MTCAGVGVDSAVGRPLTGTSPRESKRVGALDAATSADAKELRRLDPFALYALMAADEAWRQSGLEGPLEDAGSIVTTGIGGLQTVLDQDAVLMSRGPDRVSPFLVPMMMPNAATAAVSMRFGLGGPCETVTTACAAGTHAIGNAARLVASGRCDIAVAGGAEAVIVEFAEAGFRNMTALSNTGLSRPFDVDRDGFVMGEGAGILILEDWDHAHERGATISGRGHRRRLHRRRASHHRPRSERPRRGALHELGPRRRRASPPSDVSHINAHGTSTPLNDFAESVAVHQVFGDDAPPTTSIKGHLGHSLGGRRRARGRGLGADPAESTDPAHGRNHRRRPRGRIWTW